MATSAPVPPVESKPRKRIEPVGPRLRVLLWIVFALFAFIGINSAYLGVVTFLEWQTGRSYQNFLYQYMFLLHLAMGFAIVLPVIAFGLFHILRTRTNPNRRAARVGYALLAASIVLLVSGVVLTRLEGIIEVRDPNIRGTAYWAHVIAPIAVAWLFVLHRLAGPRIRWRYGAIWLGAAAVMAVGMVQLHHQNPAEWSVEGPASGEQYFFPSLSRTDTGGFIPARALLNDKYCMQCHGDIHDNWEHSAHRLSSFNNPAYLASVLETRKAMFKRDGNVHGARFCAGCHDPVPFFSGAFDEPHFDDPDYDLASDKFAQAGITCTACHAITNVNSPRGNADYTISEPIHYPFANSDNDALQWINRTLVKAKPEFHKKTFLKPLHQTAEFCSTCHKVHLPVELNDYKFLRGQNHYDSYLLSGVSGHGITSFYYPPKAVHNCNSCHMPLHDSADFGADYFDDSGKLKVHDHQFPSANTALPWLTGAPEWVNDKHRAFLDGVMRVDIFGVKRGGTIDGELIAPIRPEVPELVPGESYLIETIIRTVKMGHLFTQGTADSNEIWMDVTVTQGDRVIGRSGGMKSDGEVDPWTHFVNAFVLDRDGNRIDRRNAEDIFVPLYNHQIPPGAGDVVHYRLDVPANTTEPITIDVQLKYRKFDTTYMRFFQGDDFDGNDLPITLLARDTVTLPVLGGAAVTAPPPSDIVPWQRWNDYGIGLFRKGNEGANRGELRQAEEAFSEVEAMGRPDGPLNRARVYIKEGRLDDAIAALNQAANHQPAAPPWSVAWFTGVVEKQNGRLDNAIDAFRTVIEMDTQETREREFDFAQDYRVLNELGQTIYERARQERGDANKTRRLEMMRESVGWFERALKLDPENVTAHYNLGLLFTQLGETEEAQRHRSLHEKYKPDDNARDRAISAARLKYPAASHASEAIVIWDLHRPGAFELPAEQHASTP